MLFNLKKKEASFKKTLCINHCNFFYSENLFSSIHLLLTDCSTHGCSQSIGEVRCTPWTVHQSIAHASVRTYGQFSVRQTLSPVEERRRRSRVPWENPSALQENIHIQYRSIDQYFFSLQASVSSFVTITVHNIFTYSLYG